MSEIKNEDERFYKDIFINHEYDFAIPNRKNMIVVDVGAHSGTFTEYIYPKAKKIYAIEVEIDNFNRLKERIDRKKLKRAMAFNYAVGGKMGDRTIYTHMGNGGYSIVDVNNNIRGIAQGITLEKFMTDNKISKIDLLKIDCEGAESEILNESLDKVLDKIDVIIGELHVGKDSVLDYLRSRKFIVTQKSSNFLAKRQ